MSPRSRAVSNSTRVINDRCIESVEVLVSDEPLAHESRSSSAKQNNTRKQQAFLEELIAAKVVSQEDIKAVLAGKKVTKVAGKALAVE